MFLAFCFWVCPSYCLLYFCLSVSFLFINCSTHMDILFLFLLSIVNPCYSEFLLMFSGWSSRFPQLYVPWSCLWISLVWDIYAWKWRYPSYRILLLSDYLILLKAINYLEPLKIFIVSFNILNKQTNNRCSLRHIS